MLLHESNEQTGSSGEEAANSELAGAVVTDGLNRWRRSDVAGLSDVGAGVAAAGGNGDGGGSGGLSGNLSDGSVAGEVGGLGSAVGLSDGNGHGDGALGGLLLGGFLVSGLFGSGLLLGGLFGGGLLGEETRDVNTSSLASGNGGAGEFYRLLDFPCHVLRKNNY